MEAWTTIRYLHAQGKSIRAITKELGVSRNTVRSALRDDNSPGYVRQKRRPSKLDPFADQIKHMFFDQQFIGTRILREIRALGYTGGESILYMYLATLKADSPSGKPDSRLTERFETAPAQQGQFDWSPYTVSLGGETVRVIVYCLTLSYSRRKFYWPSLNETQSSIFEAIETALHYFGGSPKELLVDNPRAFVTNPHPEHFSWNTHFLELCGHYSIKPVACQVARARTKGKVERPFFYLEQHFIKGKPWQSFEAFAQGLATFITDELDLMVHSTTGQRPLDRFQEERELLTPLPSLPFIGTHEEMRKVSWDCLISFFGSRYSVPWQYAGKQVWLRPSQGAKLVIRSQKGEEIALHTISPKKGSTNINPDHYEGLRKGLPKTRVVLEQSFLRLFPHHAWFVENLFIQHKPNGVDHLRAILALAELYSPDDMAAAFAAARQYNTYSHRFIRGLLEFGSASNQDLKPIPIQSMLRETSASAPPITADLDIYQRILEARR